jgi:hypothetical protein
LEKPIGEGHLQNQGSTWLLSPRTFTMGKTMCGEHFQNEGLVLITFALCFMMGKAPSQNAVLNVIIVKYQWVFTNISQFCFLFIYLPFIIN